MVRGFHTGPSSSRAALGCDKTRTESLISGRTESGRLDWSKVVREYSHWNIKPRTQYKNTLDRPKVSWCENPFSLFLVQFWSRENLKGTTDNTITLKGGKHEG